MLRALAPVLNSPSRAVAALGLALVVGGCEPATTGDRVIITVGDGGPVKMDLEPLTLTEIDNTVSIAIEFEASETATTTGTIVFSQYRIDYGLGDEEAPYIAGEIRVQVEEGGTATAILKGAAQAQLDWVNERYHGVELDIPARVSLAGAYDELEGVTVFTEYTATFAEYR